VATPSPSKSAAPAAATQSPQPAAQAAPQAQPRGAVPPQPAARTAAATPPQPSAAKEVSSAAFKAAFEIAKVLSNLSKSDQRSAMQMAGVQIGLSVTSQFARVAASAAATPAPVPKGNKGGRAPPPQAKWGPDVKAKQSQIASLNKAIAEESAKLGQQLPSDHALLVQRSRAFRDLQGLKGSSRASQ
jgi:hypothetical protein